jgi:hypothetical protein
MSISLKNRLYSFYNHKIKRVFFFFIFFFYFFFRVNLLYIFSTENRFIDIGGGGWGLIYCTYSVQRTGLLILEVGVGVNLLICVFVW